MAKAVSMEPVPTTTWWIYLLEGIGAVLIGLLLLMAPAATVVAITLFLGFYWLFVGVLELVRMFVDRSGCRGTGLCSSASSASPPVFSC